MTVTFQVKFMGDNCSYAIRRKTVLSQIYYDLDNVSAGYPARRDNNYNNLDLCIAALTASHPGKSAACPLYCSFNFFFTPISTGNTVPLKAAMVSP